MGQLQGYQVGNNAFLKYVLACINEFIHLFSFFYLFFIYLYSYPICPYDKVLKEQSTMISIPSLCEVYHSFAKFVWKGCLHKC